ncbi:MAG TPA: alpha/beta hydrolase [Anaerolineales bacterium]
MANGNYSNINGLNLYYEVHGTGKPLVLLHGGFGGTWMFEQNLPAFSTNRQVIAMELQGHGHTADIDRPLSFEHMADDVAALIEHLGIGDSIVLGYSLGGGVALQTAIRHPNLVGKLVVVSAPCKSDGWYPEVRAGMKLMNAEVGKTWVGSPMHQAYARVDPLQHFLIPRAGGRGHPVSGRGHATGGRPMRKASSALRPSRNNPGWFCRGKVVQQRRRCR